MAKADLANLSIKELQSEIRRRERQVRSLVQKRERLLAELARIEAEIAESDADLAAQASSIAGRTGRKRPRNDSTLADALAEILSNKTMSVTEVATAVQRAGYKTTSPNFRTIVNQTRLKDDRFKKVARGKYTVKVRSVRPKSAAGAKAPS